jgi:SMC interacting uncharacterized protein involved in chromosome segregation
MHHHHLHTGSNNHVQNSCSSVRSVEGLVKNPNHEIEALRTEHRQLVEKIEHTQYEIMGLRNKIANLRDEKNDLHRDLSTLANRAHDTDSNARFGIVLAAFAALLGVANTIFMQDPVINWPPVDTKH